MSTKQWHGVYEGTVQDNKDPEHKSRCRLKVPQVLHTAVSNWAPPHGTVTKVPKIGAKVYVQFTGGEPAKPVYSESKPAATTKVHTAPVVPPVVTMLGQEGTFGVLTSMTTTSTGDSFAIKNVPNWQFGAGVAMWWLAAMSDGQIVMSTLPQTNDEVSFTASHSEINVYDPARDLFYKNIVTTSTGASSDAVNPKTGVGAPDMGGGDVRQVLTPQGTELCIFTSDGAGYPNFDVGTYGLYPTIGFLQKNSDGDWRWNQSLSLTPDQWQATNPTAYSVIEQSESTDAYGNKYWGTRGANQIAVFPQSGNVVIGHYFDGNGYTSGCISVVSPTGELLATYQIPSVASAVGTITTLACRDMQTDPTSILGDERFVIIYDVYGNGLAVDGAIQEFSYDASTQTITPMSLPCISTDITPNNEHCTPFTSIFDSKGTLYFTQGGYGLSASPMAVYEKSGGERALVSDAPATGEWWTVGTNWATEVEPTYSLGFPVTDNLSVFCEPRSVDPVTGAVITISLTGLVTAAMPSGTSVGSNELSAADSTFAVQDMLSANDATFATGMGSWTGYLGSFGTTSSPPVAPPVGTNAMTMEEYGGDTQVQTGKTTYTAVPGHTYNFAAYFLAGTTARTCSLRFNWIESDGSTITSESALASITDNTTSWTQASLSAIAPSNAAYVQLVAIVDSEAAGEVHYMASCSLIDGSATGSWTGYLTGTSLSPNVTYPGSGSSTVLRMQTAFANDFVVQATSGLYPVTPLQEYIATSYWQAADDGTSDSLCTVYITWYESNGTTEISESPCNRPATDSPGTWTAVSCSAGAPENAAYAKLTLRTVVPTLAQQQTHYVGYATFTTQPYKSVRPIDYGGYTLRKNGYNTSTGRSCIIGRTLWIPVEGPFTTAQTTTYDDTVAKGVYTPIFTPQFLVSVDLNTLVGGAAAVSTGTTTLDGGGA